MSGVRPDLLLIAPPGDPVADAVRRRCGTAWRLANLCQSPMTVDVGPATPSDRITIDGHAVCPDALRGIVVSTMPCVAPPGYSPEDSRYLERETFAAWMALLRNAACRVVNRPAFDALPASTPSFQVRVMARRAGIPTIDDEICEGADLLRRRALGENLACLDLCTQAAFWLSSEAPVDAQRLYSVTNVTSANRQLLLACVDGLIRGQWIGRDVSRSTLREAAAAACQLAGLMRLDYAFVSFAAIERRALFCRVYTFWPADRSHRLVRSTADALLETLAAA
jgi:hypothetical protein